MQRRQRATPVLAGTANSRAPRTRCAVTRAREATASKPAPVLLARLQGARGGTAFSSATTAPASWTAQSRAATASRAAPGPRARPRATGARASRAAMAGPVIWTAREVTATKPARARTARSPPAAAATAWGPAMAARAPWTARAATASSPASARRPARSPAATAGALWSATGHRIAPCPARPPRAASSAPRVGRVRGVGQPPFGHLSALQVPVSPTGPPRRGPCSGERPWPTALCLARLHSPSSSF